MGRKWILPAAGGAALAAAALLLLGRKLPEMTGHLSLDLRNDRPADSFTGAGAEK